MKSRPPSIFRPSANEMAQFLKSVPDTTIFQRPEMAEVYYSARGCKPSLRAIATGDGSIQASLLSVAFRDAPGVKHASIRGGPICGPTTLGTEAGEALIAGHEAGAKQSTLYTRLYPVRFGEPPARIVESCGFTRGEWLNILVPIRDPNIHWKKLPKDRQRGIQRGEQLGLRAKDVASESDLKKAIQLLQASAARQRFRLQHPSLFESIQTRLVPRGSAKIVLASLNGNPVAARVILISGSVVYDWYAGSDYRFRFAQPDSWLVWEILKWSFERGFTTFDFGGAGVPDTPYGPREFKKRFDGSEVRLGRYTHEHYPRILRLLSTTYRVFHGSAPL